MILQTERLRLRKIETSDFDALHELFSDPLVMYYFPRPYDEAATQRWIDWILTERYPKHGHAFWAVELTESGEFLGVCGPVVQTIEGQDYVEIAYLFKSGHWHEGYATEAARACKEYAFKQLRQPYVISLIRPINQPSRAVAERNGMTVWKTASFYGFEVLVYRADADGSPITPFAP